MGSIRHWVAPGALSDPDVVRYAATISVWLPRVFLLAYRPGFWYPGDIEYLALPVLVGVLNGLVHLRLLTNRPVTWRWMLLLSATDIALATAGVVIGGGFRSFIFLGYYPTLAVFAVVFWPSWFSLTWRRPGCPGSGVAGAWRARSGLPGGVWWTGLGKKTPVRGQGVGHSPANGE